MKRTILVLLAGLFLGATSTLLTTEKVSAQNQKPSDGCVVPKEWGTFQGSLVAGLLFQDAQGTIRAIDVRACGDGKTVIDLEIRRQSISKQ